MVLVAPDVVRYSINGTHLGRPAVNILDMVVQVGGLGASRADGIKETGEQIINTWVDQMLINLTNTYSFVSLSYIDLNSADGATGEMTASDDYSLPRPGLGGGQPLPASVAMLVTKQTNAGRGSRPGRWYVPGLGEGSVEGNFINGAELVAINERLSDMVERLTETGSVQGVEYFPTVIHTRNIGTPSDPVIEYVNNTQITNLSASARVASQRRRNRP